MMLRFTFRKGLRFIDGGKRAWTLMRQLATGKVQLEDERGEVCGMEMGELHRKWLASEFVIDDTSLGSSSDVFYLATPRDLKTFDERNQNLAKDRHEYLLRLASRPGGFVFTPGKLAPILREIADELGHPNPPAISTVYRWWCKYRATKCVTKLTDGRLRSGRKREKFAYALFEEAIYEVYLTKQKNPGKDVVDALETKVCRANLNLPEDEKIAMPSQATIYRWLGALHEHLVQRARLGKEATQKAFRTVLDKLKVTHILERIEIDHTPLDLIVIDKLTKLPLGRPWLTLAIDRLSRMIVGFYISFHAPSSFSVLQCLKRAIMPKEAWLARYPDIKTPWPARGIPVLIAVDNGMDLHGDALEDSCYEMGTQILYTPAGHPYLKGAIERMFRTINQGLIHRLPGTVFSNIDERGDYPAEEVAAIDLETLMHLLTKWIVEVYHCTKHRGLGMTPLAKWMEGQQNTIIELPTSPQQLDVLVGIPAQRSLQHYGIELDCLRYNSPELQLIRARVGGTPEIKVKFYEDDVGYIHVYDEYHEEYIRVPAIDSAYANGLSRYMHVLIREYTRKNCGRDWNHDQLRQSKLEIQEIIDHAVRDKKMGVRKKAAVVRSQDSENVLGTDTHLPLDQAPVTAHEEGLDPLPSGIDDDLPKFGTSKRNGTEG